MGHPAAARSERLSVANSSCPAHGGVPPAGGLARAMTWWGWPALDGLSVFVISPNHSYQYLVWRAGVPIFGGLCGGLHWRRQPYFATSQSQQSSYSGFGHWNTYSISYGGRMIHCSSIGSPSDI